MFIVKKRKIVIAVIAATVFFIAGGVFYSQYTSADERQKTAQIAEEHKEADQLFVEKLNLKTSKRQQVTDEDLITLTRSDRIGKVTKVILSDQGLRQVTPGRYQVQLTIQFPSKITITKTAEVTVTDDMAPVITVPRELSTTVGADFPIDQIKVKDGVDGTLAPDKIAITGFDKNKAGQQQVTISVQDKAGNKATKKVAITLNAKTPVPQEEATTDKTTSETSAESDSITENNEAIENDTEQSNPVAAVESTTVTEEATNASEYSSDGGAVAATEATSQADYEETTPAQASVARTAAPAVQTATLSFNGSTIPFIQYNGAAAAPGSGAGTWMGNGSTTDGASTHFIGHNPGDFSGVMGLGVGSAITVVDDSGNSRTYTVYEVVDVTDDGYNNNNPADDVLPRMLYAGGERISLQTCITDTVNRCVLAQ